MARRGGSATTLRGRSHFHVLVVGDRASGKTTVTEKLRAAYTDPQTLEEATHFGSLPTVTVHVWDTAMILPEISSDPHVVVVCFDVSQGNGNALSSVTSDWLPRIHQRYPGAAVVLLGTKLDLAADARLFIRDRTPVHRPLVPRRAAVAASLRGLRDRLLRRPDPRRPLAHGVNPFDWLPDELMLAIIWYVDTPDLAALAALDRRFLQLVGDATVRYGRRMPRHAAGAAACKSAAARRVDLDDNLVTLVATQWGITEQNVLYSSPKRTPSMLARHVARAPLNQAAYHSELADRRLAEAAANRARTLWRPWSRRP